MFKVPEIYRLPQLSNSSYGNNGVFLVKNKEFKYPLRCIASDGGGWEHVSVSTATRIPLWREMCFIKSLFWDDIDFVVQMHVPQKDWINCHPYCLHLWRKCGTNDFCERPQSILVGPSTYKPKRF